MTTPAPDTPTPADELRLLGQIVRRVDDLSDASKRWLLDRLSGDLDD